MHYGWHSHSCSSGFSCVALLHRTFFAHHFPHFSPGRLRSRWIIPSSLDTESRSAVLTWKSTSLHTCFGFTSWALSVKLMPRVVYIESFIAYHVWKDQPSQKNQIWKKLEAQSKTRLLTRFLLYPRETLGFAPHNVDGILVGDICLGFTGLSLIQPY